ncbi:unnamed protein product [Dibothriocephalus latus]|uniref:Uncharacterized protein n=1 Tax=Dibothriocephalus latus TaxID=60516 RepID=A0A3P7NK02_DIBLA|nr:unnamed protein product [Dibothriocephalus latus]
MSEEADSHAENALAAWACWEDLSVNAGDPRCLQLPSRLFFLDSCGFIGFVDYDTDLHCPSPSSAIFHDADSRINYGISLESSRPLRGPRKSLSVPNLLGESSYAGSCITPAVGGALPEQPNYEYRAWQALSKFALKARDTSVRTEQVEVLSRLEGILKGTETESQSGLIALLRKFGEADLLPARQRLPTSGLVYASEEEVLSAANLAKIAKDKVWSSSAVSSQLNFYSAAPTKLNARSMSEDFLLFLSAFTEDLQALRDLSKQLMKVVDLLNSQSSLFEVENYVKLKEAYRLLTYLVSLKTQKLQSELFKGLSPSLT